MAKLEELNKIYTDILGSGDPLTEEDITSSGGAVDPAYQEEDYTDDSGDGVDPRDESTKTDSEDSEVEDDNVLDEEAPEDDSEEAFEQDDDEEYEEIPDRLVAAGRRANLSDDLIIEMAETRPEMLEALARTQEEALANRGKVTENVADDHEEQLGSPDGGDTRLKKLEIKFDEDDPEISSKAKEVIQLLADRVNDLTEAVGTHEKGFSSLEEKSLAEANRRYDAYFDEAAKDVPVLGNVKSLDQENIGARKYVHSVALGVSQTMPGISEEEALAIGVNALKGQMTESQVRTKIVSDLHRQKKRFTARPKGRRSTNPDMKGKSVEERAMSRINKILDGDNEL